MKSAVKCSLLILMTLSSSGVLSRIHALAQIEPDDTLGTENSVVVPNVIINGLPADQINGGARRGALLFHSFENFNIPEGRGAYFSNPDEVNTIFSRVTGTNQSNILGTLGVLDNADLVFLNPNGVLFGPNARLDLRGSFTASTAGAVELPNGDLFSALEPEPPPLLTMNLEAPIGLVFGDEQPAFLVNTGTLEVDQTQNLTLAGGVVFSTGPLVAKSGSIGVVAALEDSLVTLGEDGRLQSWEFSQDTSGGNRPMEIPEDLRDFMRRAGVDPSEVPGGLRLGTAIFRDTVDTSNVDIGGDITLAGTWAVDTNALVDARGGLEGGDINLTGNAIVIPAATFISSGNVLLQTATPTQTILIGGPGATDGLDLELEDLNALQDGFRSITIGRADGVAPIDFTNDVAFREPVTIRAPAGAGSIDASGHTISSNGSDIALIANRDVTAGNIMSAGGNISLVSNAGNIDATNGELIAGAPFINAGNISLRAAGKLRTGRISTSGPASGDIDLTARSILLANNSEITARTSDAPGGSVTLNAVDLVSVTDGSRIRTQTAGLEDAGNIIIDTQRLIVQAISDEFTGIGTDTEPDSGGDGGDLIINASESVELIGTNSADFIPDPSNLESVFRAATTRVGLSTSSLGSGRAGDLLINQDLENPGRLEIRDRAGAAAAALSPEDNAGGGEIRINASTVEFRGLAGLATTTFGAGDAGNLSVVAEQVDLFNGATISADALGDPDQQTIGRAGDMTITARNILLDNRSRLTTTARSGDGGDINLRDVSLLRIRRGDNIGGIFTDAGTEESGGDGGNINIDASFIFGIREENSDISANAFEGRGGNIRIIDNDFIFGLRFRPERTPLSDITVSSEFGLDGEFELNTSGIDPTQGFNPLPEEPRNPGVNESCQANTDQDTVAFFDVGQGGSPPSPGSTQSSNTITANWISLQLAELTANLQNHALPASSLEIEIPRTEPSLDKNSISLEASSNRPYRQLVVTCHAN